MRSPGQPFASSRARPSCAASSTSASAEPTGFFPVFRTLLRLFLMRHGVNCLQVFVLCIDHSCSRRTEHFTRQHARTPGRPHLQRGSYRSERFCVPCLTIVASIRIVASLCAAGRPNEWTHLLHQPARHLGGQRAQAKGQLGGRLCFLHLCVQKHFHLSRMAL